MSLLRKLASSSRRRGLSIVAVLCFLAVPCVAAAVFVLKTDSDNLSVQERGKQETGQMSEQEERARKERLAAGGKENAERQGKEQKAFKERLDQPKLAKEAKITMEQALPIATNHQPGMVLEARLGRERDEVAYKVLVLDKDGTEGKVTLVVISGLDGRVIKTETAVISEMIK